MMSIEEKLSVNKFLVDEEEAHIIAEDHYADTAEKMKLVNACPAGLYKLQGDGSLSFDYAGCLECGTCRVLCLGTVIKEWNHPRGTFGVEFRYG